MEKYPEEEHRECCVCRNLVSVDDDRCLSGDEFVRVPGWFSAWDVQEMLERLLPQAEHGEERLLVERAGAHADGTPLFRAYRHAPATAGTLRALVKTFERAMERGAKDNTP